jgi:cobalt-zinc-cadmium efflux system protein
VSDTEHSASGGTRRLPSHVLSVALALTAAFMVLEAIVGYWSGSLALIADAGHMLADAGALTLALVAQSWAQRPPGKRTTYGLRRAEVLAAFVNGIGLALTALFVVKEAVERWLEPRAIRGTAMLSAAIAGLVVNAVVARMLYSAEDSSINIRAAFAHVLVDALGSVGAIVAALAVVFFDIRRADPLLSVLIAVLVAFSGWRVLKETASVLLEAVPSHLDVGDIEQTIRSCSGVAALHDLHVWRVSDGFDVLSVHVTLARGSHGADVCVEVASALRQKHGIDHATVQAEAPPPPDLVPLRRRENGPAVR